MASSVADKAIFDLTYIKTQRSFDVQVLTDTGYPEGMQV
jgi:hypothetical protein